MLIFLACVEMIFELTEIFQSIAIFAEKYLKALLASIIRELVYIKRFISGPFLSKVENYIACVLKKIGSSLSLAIKDNFFFIKKTATQSTINLEQSIKAINSSIKTFFGATSSILEYYFFATYNKTDALLTKLLSFSGKQIKQFLEIAELIIKSPLKIAYFVKKISIWVIAKAELVLSLTKTAINNVIESFQQQLKKSFKYTGSFLQSLLNLVKRLLQIFTIFIKKTLFTIHFIIKQSRQKLSNALHYIKNFLQRSRHATTVATKEKIVATGQEIVLVKKRTENISSSLSHGALFALQETIQQVITVILSVKKIMLCAAYSVIGYYQKSLYFIKQAIIKLYKITKRVIKKHYTRAKRFIFSIFFLIIRKTKKLLSSCKKLLSYLLSKTLTWLKNCSSCGIKAVVFALQILTKSSQAAIELIIVLKKYFWLIINQPKKMAERAHAGSIKVKNGASFVLHKSATASKKIVKTSWQFATTGVLLSVSMLKTIIGKMTQFLTSSKNKTSDAITFLGKATTESAKNQYEATRCIAQSQWQKTTQFAQSSLNAIYQFICSIPKTIKNGVSYVFNKVFLATKFLAEKTNHVLELVFGKFWIAFYNSEGYLENIFAIKKKNLSALALISSSAFFILYNLAYLHKQTLISSNINNIVNKETSELVNRTFFFGLKVNVTMNIKSVERIGERLKIHTNIIFSMDRAAEYLDILDQFSVLDAVEISKTRTFINSEKDKSEVCYDYRFEVLTQSIQTSWPIDMYLLKMSLCNQEILTTQINFEASGDSFVTKNSSLLDKNKFVCKSSAGGVMVGTKRRMAHPAIIFGSIIDVHPIFGNILLCIMLMVIFCGIFFAATQKLILYNVVAMITSFSVIALYSAYFHSYSLLNFLIFGFACWTIAIALPLLDKLAPYKNRICASILGAFIFSLFLLAIS